MTQRDKLFNYLTIRGYDKKWADVYREIRTELKELGVKDASKVTNPSYRLMSLKNDIMEIINKMKTEAKFFGFDMEDELIQLITHFIEEISIKIDKEIPLD